MCSILLFQYFITKRERKRKNMEFGAVFNLPFHSMPTIQSQEMLCQGTKGEKIKMYQSRNYKSVDLFIFF